MRRMKGGYPGLKWRSQNISDMSKNAVHITFKTSQKICTFLSFSSENCCYTAVKVHIPYSLDQTPSSNGRRTQIDAASFTYLSFIARIVAAYFNQSPPTTPVSTCLRYTLQGCITDCTRSVYQETSKASDESRQR